MEKPKAIRTVDELGRIVIPAQVRAMMDWNTNCALEVWVNETAGEVILKAHTHFCTYCGETENLKEFNKRYICPACQSAISKL
ncbi:MAG TPA: AbrB/MazE/SpoVT family DNA-binding domain-containing protein [Candidatus Acidoferrum sp.]|nr:AbrB/MazE/SpoVT family DNA-binding domain-containing protein [Candidatus Acidoferrum sp.]